MIATPHEDSATARSTAIAAICWVSAALIYLLAEALAASAFPDYSYAMNYISDLGVPNVENLGSRAIDSPLHSVINTAFILHGLLFATAAASAARLAQPRWRLPFLISALAHALGMVLIATVNGGQANISLGLGWVHLLGAFLAFFGGHLSAVFIGISFLRPSDRIRSGHGRFVGVTSILFGLIGILGIVLLQIDVRILPGTVLPDGVWERTGMYAIVVWEVFFGTVLFLNLRRHPPLSTSPLMPVD